MRVPLKLHEYQEEVVRRALADLRLALFLDPGLGKTAIILETFRRLLAELDVSRMLVVAPLRPCYTVWPKEVEKWRGFEGLRVHVLHGRNGRSPFWLGRGASNVYVINPEGLEWLTKQNWPCPPEMLVLDESTKFKRASSERSKNLRRLTAKLKFPRRYILTGTPSPNGVQDLHGQFLALDDGLRLGAKMKDFRENFCVPVPTGNNFWEWKPRTTAGASILDLIRDVTIRLRARDHLPGLPELVPVDRELVLPDEARGLYETLERELVLQFERGEVTAVNAGALTSKLRQMASGNVYLKDEAGARITQKIHDSKIEALEDLIEELGGEPLLVAYAHEHEYLAIQEAIGKCPRIGGGVSPREGVEVEERWNRGEIPVMLVHPASGGHGLNLQDGGGHVCWYSLPWDLELYDQFNGRLNRQGQKRARVVAHHLIASDTIDEVMAHTLRRKDRDQRALLEALQSNLTRRTA